MAHFPDAHSVHTMNAIRQTQQLNKRELENATPPSASWHADYRDTAYIYVGGLNLDLTEGDVVTIFSQYGNPTHINMVRDKETGKSKGFAFLKYEDQRSCDLAVDNLGGADILGRMLRVDHTRYKKRDDEDEDTYRIDRLEQEAESEVNGNGKRSSDTDDEDGQARHKKKRRPMLKEEQELEEMLAVKDDGEEADPMREYLLSEKREEVASAKEKERERRSRDKHRHRRTEDGDGGKDARGDERRHRHRHRHRDERGERDDGENDEPKQRTRQEDSDDEKRRRRRDDNNSHRDREHRHKSHRDSRERKSSRDRYSR